MDGPSSPENNNFQPPIEVSSTEIKPKSPIDETREELRHILIQVGRAPLGDDYNMKLIDLMKEDLLSYATKIEGESELKVDAIKIANQIELISSAFLREEFKQKKGFFKGESREFHYGKIYGGEIVRKQFLSNLKNTNIKHGIQEED